MGLGIELLLIAAKKAPPVPFQLICNLPSAPAATETIKTVKEGLEYSDLVTIVLTAVTVILAALAILVGLLALWGYAQFKEMTQKASREHIEALIKDGSLRDSLQDLILSYTSDQLKDGELRRIISERIDKLLITDASNRSDGGATVEGDTEVPFEG